MPDPEGPTRYRVLVGFEFAAETTGRYVESYNEAAARRNSPLRLTIGHLQDVMPLAGALSADERARVLESP
jgi:hypothetical protein